MTNYDIIISLLVILGVCAGAVTGSLCVVWMMGRRKP
jgi:hypothetical protein